MKNIYLIPTEKETNIISDKNKLELIENRQIAKTINSDVVGYYIYIVSNIKSNLFADGNELNDKDFVLDLLSNEIRYTIEDSFISPSHIKKYAADIYKKIILTNDTELIKSGVQEIDDDLLEWFVKNPVDFVEVEKVKDPTDRAWYNTISCRMIYKIIIPNQENVQTDHKGKPLTFWGGLENKTSEIDWSGFPKSTQEKAGFIPKEESYNSKRGLQEIKLKDLNTCEHFKEVGCLKDICDCYTLVSKSATIEEIAERYYQENKIKSNYPHCKNSFIDGYNCAIEQFKNK